MKKIMALTMVFIMLLTGLSVAYGFELSIQYLEEEDLDAWGILALYSRGVDIEDRELDEINSSITTDYEAYLMGAIPLGKDVDNYVEKIIKAQRESGKFADYIDGRGEDLVNAHIWGILSLYAAGVDSYDREKALEWLKKNQNEDGGFPIYTGDKNSDIDLTAMAVIAYNVLGLENNSVEIREALDYVERNLDKRESCEALSWYILAKVKLGLDIEEELYNRLQNYKLEGGGFKHIKMASKPNYMATWHGILAETDYKNNISIFTRLNNENKFRDINRNTYGYKEIIELLNRGIISGYPDNTFKPNRGVTRAEFAKLIVYGMGFKDEISGKTDEFLDLKEHWANKIVKVAVDKGLIKGLGSEKFDPEEKITGAQVAAILVRAMGLEEEAKAIEGANWYDGYVKVARDKNLLYKDFQPEKYATRAQCAVAIEKIVK